MLLLLAAALLAAAEPALAGETDIERGKALFAECAICHRLKGDGTGTDGPDLCGVVGRKVASEKGYVYSKAMARKGGTWTRKALDRFIAAPAVYVANTRMAFGGLADSGERRSLIEFLAACR
jgi:cytochrome c